MEVTSTWPLWKRFRLSPFTGTSWAVNKHHLRVVKLKCSEGNTKCLFGLFLLLCPSLPLRTTMNCRSKGKHTRDPFRKDVAAFLLSLYAAWTNPRCTCFRALREAMQALQHSETYFKWRPHHGLHLWGDQLCTVGSFHLTSSQKGCIWLVQQELSEGELCLHHTAFLGLSCTQGEWLSYSSNCNKAIKNLSDTLEKLAYGK